MCYLLGGEAILLPPACQSPSWSILPGFFLRLFHWQALSYLNLFIQFYQLTNHSFSLIAFLLLVYIAAMILLSPHPSLRFSNFYTLSQIKGIDYWKCQLSGKIYVWKFIFQPARSYICQSKANVISIYAAKIFYVTGVYNGWLWQISAMNKYVSM